jgi:hypothetical protein
MSGKRRFLFVLEDEISSVHVSAVICLICVCPLPLPPWGEAFVVLHLLSSREIGSRAGRVWERRQLQHAKHGVYIPRHARAKCENTVCVFVCMWCNVLCVSIRQALEEALAAANVARQADENAYGLLWTRQRWLPGDSKERAWKKKRAGAKDSNKNGLI